MAPTAALPACGVAFIACALLVAPRAETATLFSVLGLRDADTTTRDGSSTTASGSSSTTTPPTPSDQKPRSSGPEYRLPETAIPISYDLDLHVDSPQNDMFEGTMTITLVAVRETNFLTLHVDNKVITVDSVKFSGVASELPTLKILKTDSATQTMTLNWDGFFEVSDVQKQTLTAGQKYIIELKYHGNLRTDMYGFYRSTYKSVDGKESLLAATQFEPAYARSAFPCWDEPHYKATFQLSISFPANRYKIALSNTDQKGGPTTDDKTGITTQKFKRTPAMSTYLVAFVVCDFAFAAPPTPTPAPTPTPTTTPAPQPSDDVSSWYKVYVRPDNIQQAAYAAEVGAQSLIKLQEYLGIKYTEMGLGKLDLIAIPDFSAGAMENWGLVTFRETALMFTDGESTEASKESIAMVIAHEQAHMWFGDLVSPAWWGYVWLNEGFARYFQHVAMDMVQPKWRLMDTFIVNTLQGALSFDALESTHPMSATVYEPNEIQGIFDRISYDKGASVLHMTRNLLGDNSFQSALQSYLAEMRGWTASPIDLFQHLDAFRGQAQPALPDGITIATVLESWTEQPGYPVVSIRSEPNGTVVATQMRFLTSSASAENSSRWWLPLTFTKQNADFGSPSKVWLDPREMSTKIADKKEGWIIANVKQTGFYRVNYDEENWDALATYLQSEKDFEKIPLLNRAQILDDALSLARAGLLRYPAALELTRYLKLEKDPIPWTAAFPHMAFLRKMLAGDSALEQFNVYQIELLDAVYKEVGFDQTDAETADTDTNHLRLMFRSTLLSAACGLGLQDCVDKAVAEFAAFKASGTEVKSSLRSTVYCIGLRNGTTNEWKLLWDRYLKSTSPGEKSLILGALGCTSDNATLQQYLSYSLQSDKIRPQDASAVFSSVLGGGNDNFDIAFDFFKANFKEMITKYGGWSSMQKVVEGLADKILDESRFKELEDFLSKNIESLGVAQAAAVRSLETARSNLAWRRDHLRSVSDWVLGKTSNSASGCWQGFSHFVTLAVFASIARILT